jgi:hypothetical protein
VVVRFSGSPVYGLNNTDKLTPDAVMIYGDVANGKAAITETAVSTIFQNGYAGVHLYDEKTETFALISGTFKPHGSTSYKYDVDANVQELLKECLDSNDTVDSQGTIGGELMQIAARRLDVSFQVNEEFEQKALPQYYPYVFIVRGTSLSQWSPFQQSQLGILIFTIVFEFFVLAGMAVLVYRPMSKFIHYLDEENLQNA